jgi:acetyltransferase
MSRSDVRPLLFPRSLALVGATPRRPDVVAGVLRGEVPAFGVNPNYSDVLGLPCVPSVAAIPDPPEMAILLVGHARLVDAFEDAAAAGVRAFVVPGLGNEAGPEGARLTAWLIRRAGEICAAVALVLEALARMAHDHPEIVEVDVNPLILGPDGAVAVDALVVVDRRGTQ